MPRHALLGVVSPEVPGGAQERVRTRSSPRACASCFPFPNFLRCQNSPRNVCESGPKGGVLFHSFPEHGDVLVHERARRGAGNRGMRGTPHGLGPRLLSDGASHALRGGVAIPQRSACGRALRREDEVAPFHDWSQCFFRAIDVLRRGASRILRAGCCERVEMAYASTP